MAPDPVRAAIFACLSGDATLKALLSTPSAIFEETAPAGTKSPYLIFQHLAGTEQWTFGEGNERAIWLVKGVCRGGSATPVEEIDARCASLLHGARLAVPAGSLAILRESTVRYGEESSGEQYRHRGGKYRIFT